MFTAIDHTSSTNSIINNNIICEKKMRNQQQQQQQQTNNTIEIFNIKQTAYTFSISKKKKKTKENIQHLNSALTYANYFTYEINKEMQKVNVFT